MPTIENSSRQLVIVAKNSGESIYLAPGEFATVPQAEINGNAKIDKLVRTGAISVAEKPPKAPAEDAGTRRKSKSTKR
jgi:hypothetical protein